MRMARLDYLGVDSDNHYYETRDCFTRHIEARFRDRTVRVEAGEDDTEVVRVGDRVWNYMDPKFDETNPPGSLKEIVRQKGNVEWKDSYSREHMLPAYKNRDARLELMDEQGVEAVVLFPTMAVTVENLMLDDVELTYASLRSFNRWLDDDWGWAYQDRIFCAALLSLLDRDEAVRELDRVLAEGARVIHLRPGPAAGRSPADPYYDAFWARVEEAGVPVAFHISESGYNELFAGAWGETANPTVRKQSAFQWAAFHGDRPIMDTLTALIFHNLFGRFPALRVMSVENGSGWVSYLLSNLDKKKGMGRFGPWIGGRPNGRPSDIFKRHVFVSPYPEDDIPALVEQLGADRVLFGSDHPHPEGLANPLEFASLLEGTPADQVRQVMRGNCADLLGLDS